MRFGTVYIHIEKLICKDRDLGLERMILNKYFEMKVQKLMKPDEIKTTKNENCIYFFFIFLPITYVKSLFNPILNNLTLMKCQSGQ